MLVRIANLISNPQLQRVQELLSQARFVDGKLSAGMAAERIKKNQEAAPEHTQIEALNNIVMGNLVRHPVYKNATLPHRVAAPFYARYTPGMYYGDHVDDPVMGIEGRYRSDVSISIFLNDPGLYEGGELVIRSSFGEHKVKYNAGDAVLYPSSSLHRVAEVTRGERLVAVTWVQSLVRDPSKREILYELSQAREKMLRSSPGTSETAHVNTAYVNLVRMWAEL